ncbi:hypothetical protein QWT92_12755, partial [Pasteurella multocida]|uniref:hypothetical protein n=1 Tax=Pasteurella multocida TaxID=747 RepID=UPI0029A0C05A
NEKKPQVEILEVFLCLERVGIWGECHSHNKHGNEKSSGAPCCDYMHDDPLSAARFILECHQAQSLLSSHLHLVMLHIAKAYLMKH